jgi:glycosyltransferase involved in cell wall biosynthesis
MLVGKWKYRGIGRYISSILKPLDKNDIVAYIPKKSKIDYFNFISKGWAFFPFWEQMALPWFIRKSKINFLLCPSITSPIMNLTGIKKIIIVYDLIFMESFAELPPSHSIYNTIGRIYRKFVAPLSYRNADTIISISEYSKKELIKRFKINPNKIFVIPCSVTNNWFNNTIIPAENRTHTLLSVTGDSPSKNLPSILLAFSYALKHDEASNFKLRIVGVAKKSHNYYNKLIDKIGISNNVILENFVSDSELQILYQTSWASLTLSLYEGFGIPVVEAMASGTPVVCSNTTSLPEVADVYAYYADPRDLESMKNAILKVINATSTERNIIAIQGKNFAKKYSEEIVNANIKGFWNKLSI